MQLLMVDEHVGHVGDSERHRLERFREEYGMILGLTFVHIVLSLVGIVFGFVVMFGLLAAKRLDRWTALFLASTVATSVTGFAVPFVHLLLSHFLGIISLVVLAVAILTRYVVHLAGTWRVIYVLGAVAALYFNIFVLIAQAF